MPEIKVKADRVEEVKTQAFKPLVRFLKIKIDGRHIGDVLIGRKENFIYLYEVPHMPGWKCLKWSTKGIRLDGRTQIPSIEFFESLALESVSHCQEIHCRFYQNNHINCYTVMASLFRYLLKMPMGNIDFEVEGENDGSG